MAKKEAGLEMFAAKGGDAIYLALLKKLRAATSDSAVLVEVKQTCVHLIAAKGEPAFAGVHPRKDAVMVTLKLEEPWESKRVRKTEQASKSRYHCDLVVSAVSEVDAELIGVAKRAWELAASKGMKKAGVN